MSVPWSQAIQRMTAALKWHERAQLGRFSMERVAAARAARVAVGVVLPLLVGLLTGHIQYGAYAALGALPAGFASFQGETRSRVAAVLLASAGMALSTFVGATAAEASPWLLVPIVAAWGYLTGLSVSLGSGPSVAILQWSVALLIAAGVPAGPSEAALHAGLVLAGGLLQAVLVAASWTLRPGETERSALAASYAALAVYASRLSEGVFGPPSPLPLPAAATVLDPNPLLPGDVRLILMDLLEQAERVRASLAALATQAVQQPRGVDDLRALLVRSAEALNLTADALRAPRMQRQAKLDALDACVARLTIADDVHWRWSGEALLGQLRSVARMAGALVRTPGRAAPISSAAAGARGTTTSLGWQNEFARSLATLRANVGTHTEAGRHALRLAAVLALAEIFVQATGLYQGRWAALTIFLVLKPDYASTFSRGIERALGTALGAAAGAAVVEAAHHSHGAMVAAAGVAIAIAYALFEASYLFFAVFLTVFIVVLLALMGLPVLSTAEARIYDTVIGAALALAAYAVWPTWERTTAQEKFARLTEAHRDYASALLGELADPGSTERASLRALQAAARRARSDAEAAATRLAGEPSQGRFSPDMAELLIGAGARLAQAELALHALVLSEHAAAAAVPRADDADAARVDRLRMAQGNAMTRIAQGLRALRAPAPIPALRPIYSELASNPALRNSPLVPIIDQLIDATTTLDAIVRDRFTA